MSFETNSPNMNLPIPGTGLTSGPQYATDTNNCLSIIDGHNHSSGSGVQITPAGININADLSYGNQNATSLRSVRFFAQSAPLALGTDLGCLYESGVDLYFNDGAGNQVRITQSGNVAGTPGSIASLTSPASASYVSANQTFVWQSNSNVPANMDGGSFIFRNITASSKGITVSAPNALGSNYSLILPALPAQTNVMTLDTSGNMGSSTWDAVGTNMTATGANAIAATMTSTGANSVINSVSACSNTAGANAIAGAMSATGGNSIRAVTTRAVQSSSAGVGEVLISPTCSTFTTSSSTPTAITNLTGQISVSSAGRPVIITCIADGDTAAAHYAFWGVSDGNLVTGPQAVVTLKRGSTVVGQMQTEVLINPRPGTSDGIFLPPSSIMFVDTPGFGTFNYTLYLACSSGSLGFMSYTKLMIYEMS